MKRSKALGALLFCQRFINQIREENRQISKTSHIDHSTFPCFLNPEMVQAGKTRQERKDLSCGQKTWAHFFPPECCLCLGRSMHTLIPQMKDRDYPASLSPTRWVNQTMSSPYAIRKHLGIFYRVISHSSIVLLSQSVSKSLLPLPPHGLEAAQSWLCWSILLKMGNIQGQLPNWNSSTLS